MTNYIEISTGYPSRPSKSAVNQGRWQRYLLLGLATNLAFWGSAFFYLKVTPPTYTSSSALNLPEAASNANVTLPGIGQASYQDSSPYGSNSSQDPRENYKFIAQSESVLKGAAAQLNMSLGEFGSPQVKVLDNTTIMTVQFKGASPQEAQNKSLAFYKALEARLNELRTQEGIRRDAGFQTALNSSQKKLQSAQKSLSDYKARSGLNSDDQIKDLTTNIEQLRRQRAEILAQQQQASTRLRQLSASLKLSAGQATDAFVLQSDQIFQQNLKDYSEASAAVVVLESKFLPIHPTVVAEKAKRDAAQQALLARGQALLGRPVSLGTLKQLNLSSAGSDSGRDALFEQIVTVQADQKGLTAQAQAIDQQIAQLENRLKNLVHQGSNLDALKRDMQVAEAVFSSTLTRLDIGKSNASGSYPLIQVVAEPSLPDSPTSPKKSYVYFGAAVGSLFSTTGLVLLWLRSCKRKHLTSKDT
ncbi:GumC family protein [Scytonema sp. PRP1]|uniref:GumC family protein n=1 Tax=Scytonema sp. PRP1 TaxID=3120513 RepID=UPI002FD78513